MHSSAPAVYSSPRRIHTVSSHSHPAIGACTLQVARSFGATEQAALAKVAVQMLKPNQKKENAATAFLLLLQVAVPMLKSN